MSTLSPAQAGVAPAPFGRGQTGRRTDQASSFASFSGLRSSVQSISVHCARSARVAHPRHAAPPQPMASVRAAAAGVAAAPVAVLPVLNFEGAPAGEAELSLKTARPESAKGLVHRAVITQLQNRRRGTASTLTRAEVRGGGKKPLKQKGTGNARMGSRRTPLRPGGGVVFGPKPCDWTIKMNKKERRLAVGTALQSAAVNMTIVEDVKEADFPIAKTREFVAALARWGVDYKRDNAIFFTTDLPPTAELSSRNIEKLKVVTPRYLTIYDILKADKLVVTLSGLAYLNTRFGGEFDGEGEEDELDEEGVQAAAELIMEMMGGAAEEGEEEEGEDGEEAEEERGEGDDGEQ